MTGVDQGRGGGGDRVAVGFAMVTAAALLFSLVPVTIDRAVSDAEPTAASLGFLFGYVISLSADRARLRSQVRQLSDGTVDVSAIAVWRHLRLHPGKARVAAISVGLAGVSALGNVAFASATAHVDASVAAAMYEAWPIVWLMTVSRIDRASYSKPNRCSRTSGTYLLMALAVPALALVAASAGTADTAEAHGGFPLLGVSLAVVAPVLAALGAGALLFSDRVLYKNASSTDGVAVLEEQWKPRGVPFEETELAGALNSVMNRTALIAGRCITASALIPAALLISDFRSSHFWTALGSGLIIGALLNGPANIMLHEAHLRTTRREIISLQYLAPLLALLWLAWWTGIEIARWDWLLVGALTVVAVNLLINLDPETTATRTDDDSATTETAPNRPDTPDTARAGIGRPVGYLEPELEPVTAGVSERNSLRALVVTMLTAGGFVLFRPELIDDARLMWLPGNYWAALAVAATVFALLLAFRLTRIETLLAAEDLRTLSLVRRIELLPNTWFGNHRPEQRTYLIAWVRHLNAASRLSEYRRCYNQAHKALTAVITRRNKATAAASGSVFSIEERAELAAICADLDSLALGRQQAREFAERVALWLIGAAVIALSVLIPAEEGPWARFLADSLAVTLTSVVVYLLAHLADLRRSRSDQLLIEHPGPNHPDWKHLPQGLYVRFRDQTDTSAQRIAAAVLITGIATAIGALLAWSRLGG